MAERVATAVWNGGLVDGSGTFSSGSGVFTDLPVTWVARTGEPEGKTSPEELLASAHASCYAMAFSYLLQNSGTPPQRLEVTSKVGFTPKAGGGFEVSYSHLTVKGQVAGLDQAKFAELAAAGEQNCPISNALRNNLKITVDATLE
jgi:osmotically inducible protein OsmC